MFVIIMIFKESRKEVTNEYWFTLLKDCKPLIWTNFHH